QPGHFMPPNGVHFGARFLMGMNSKRAQEARYPVHLRASITKSEKQIPVDRKAEALVDRAADLFPDPAPPEQCFLWDIVGPGQDVVVMRWQNPTPDLRVVFVDDDAMAVHHIDRRVVRKISGHVLQRARQ